MTACLAKNEEEQTQRKMFTMEEVQQHKTLENRLWVTHGTIALTGCCHIIQTLTL